ncbi:MAG: dTMP kinase [Jatrophihabitans sp.]|uniref:dTMP kinase n=1 Tax=Jatrophihabitans sp. TaxID=1932789 RepID=UPI003F7FD522
MSVFIAFEGGEGVGKTTQIGLLADWLRGAGRTVRVTFEPGDSPLGAHIRRLLLDPDSAEVSPRAEALLYAADRAHHVETVILPALAAGEVVVTDRYVDSTLAYQGAGRDLPGAERINAWATNGLVPHLTVLLDLDPAVGLARARRRAALDRLEGASLDFHRAVRAAFLRLAEADPARYLVLDAGAPPEALAQRIQEVVGGLL